jgi:predicted small lipoprotein YifL
MTPLIGRTARRSLRSRSPLLPGLLILALTMAVTACGVKNDLAKPNGQSTTTKDEHDPSKPPYPLGR